MPELNPFDYAIVRVTPNLERGEFINVGVILFCRPKRFLQARINLPRPRLAALSDDLNVDDIEQHLAHIPIICAGGRAAGPIGALPITERFHWLVAPRSTVIQISSVHTGLCADPAETLDRLFTRLAQW